ncbi:MAG: cysteine--tRNA ligase, partial [Candidatus Berkiellales bacterium]
EEPRATQHIDKIIDMIAKLEKNGAGYIADNGDVYFQVDRYASYGQLAHRDLDQLQAGARVDIVEEKRSPLDFVLWKMAKEGEPSWDSPWGKGRPGWHIECSAMSTATLGDTFDIHGGGADLVFPHHENERAQSECATGKTFVNTWMHVGFVQIDKEKMSKSLNNFFTIREVLKAYDSEVIRYFLIASHYRSPVNFASDQLEQAKNALESLYTALRGVDLSTVTEQPINNPFYQRFIEVMNDDFNTPLAISVIFDCVHALNSAREKGDPQYIEHAAVLKLCGNILGLLERDPTAYLQGKTENSDQIELMISEREKARQARNWARADEIRQMLLAKGVVLEDTAQGTIWRRG